MRRDASARVIRNRLANAAASFPPNSVGVGLFAELVDHRMLDGGQPAAHLSHTLQHGQPLGGGQRVAPQIQGALEAGFERVEDLDDLFPTTRTHVRIIATRSDKPCRAKLK